MSEEPEPGLTKRDAFELADRCVRMRRPLGWRAVEIIVEEAMRLRRQVDTSGGPRDD